MFGLLDVIVIGGVAVLATTAMASLIIGFKLEKYLDNRYSLENNDKLRKMAEEIVKQQSQTKAKEKEEVVKVSDTQTINMSHIETLEKNGDSKRISGV